MPNPLFSNRTSPNGATAPDNPLNTSYKRYARGYNRFNLSRKFYNTERYADINLVDVVEGVEGDRLPFGSKHKIRSYTMNAPKMFNITKKTSYFMVDNQAILPNNWKKVYKKPNKGDDVADDVNCFSTGLLRYVDYLLSNLGYASANQAKPWFGLSRPSDEDVYTQNNYNVLWRLIFLLESIFSNGSLLASMNCHLSSFLKVVSDYSFGTYSDIDTGVSFDSWLQETFSRFSSSNPSDDFLLYFKIPSLSDKYFIAVDSDDLPVGFRSDFIKVSVRSALDMLRTYPDFSFYFVPSSQVHIARFDYLLERLKLLKVRYSVPTDGDDVDAFGLNLSRLVAYQLVATQFYTRDSVDNVYTAELFMQNAKMISQSFVASTPVYPRFIYNGVSTEFDVFSGHTIDLAFLTIADYFLGAAGNFRKFNWIPFKSAYSYLHMLLFYRKSLRYGDYFTGAKTRPLAPEDNLDAPVVANGVSAVNMTRSILLQRFANAVERVNNTWKDYLAGVTDGVAAPDPCEPRFLASASSLISGFEVENTAENQGNVVTLLKSSDSNYIYEVEVGSPCIVIGVSTYEIPRVYSRTVERFFKHVNRYDMFNKFTQNFGDQDITMNERSAAFSPTRTFAYTPRHMEYKQRYPIASGGFVENLNGYAFITDNDQSGQNDIDFNQSGLVISSSYIRNRNSEIDRFFSSLTGLTLASYFHFIVEYDNIVDSRRQMEYSPSVL